MKCHCNCKETRSKGQKRETNGVKNKVNKWNEEQPTKIPKLTLRERAELAASVSLNEET